MTIYNEISLNEYKDDNEDEGLRCYTIMICRAKELEESCLQIVDMLYNGRVKSVDEILGGLMIIVCRSTVEIMVGLEYVLLLLFRLGLFIIRM